MRQVWTGRADNRWRQAARWRTPHSPVVQAMPYGVIDTWGKYLIVINPHQVYLGYFPYAIYNLMTNCGRERFVQRNTANNH